MRWCGIIALVGLAACGKPDNDLWGSLDQSFSLEFDRVDIVKQGFDLRIEYLRDIGEGTEKVCKVVLETENMKISGDSDIEDEVFMQRVTVEREAADGIAYPEVTGGQLHFDSYSFKAGGTMDGDFTAVFKNGLNLFGNFKKRVREISLE